MRWRDAFGFVVGGLVVHAACSVNSVSESGHDAGVTDARADDSSTPTPASPTFKVTEVKCEKSFDNGGATTWYAEADFPGRSKDDLARVIALSCAKAPVPGYSCVALSAFPRDGAVAGVGCAMGEVVRFIAPTS